VVIGLAEVLRLAFSFAQKVNTIEDVTVEKRKFDALLQRMIATPPTPQQEVKASPKKRKPRK
jgi:hypothetical protein